jgi:hypothetical protein
MQLDCKTISRKALRNLAAGMYVHCNDLIRQYNSSSNPADRRETRIGDHLFVSSQRPRSRTVDTQLDWFEVMLSSIFPFQVQQLESASSLNEAHALAKTLQQYVCYSLHAVTLFRHHPASFAHVLKYLESHREQCVSQNTDIAQPNALTLQSLHQTIMKQQTFNVSSNNRPSSSSASSSSSTSSSSAKSSGGKNRNKTVSECGQFNSRKGCQFGASCKYPHICRECKSVEHNKTTCPIFLKSRTNTNTNTKSDSKSSQRK